MFVKRFKRLLSISLALFLAFSPVEFVGEIFGGIESRAEESFNVNLPKLSDFYMQLDLTGVNVLDSYTDKGVKVTVYDNGYVVLEGKTEDLSSIRASTEDYTSTSRPLLDNYKDSIRHVHIIDNVRVGEYYFYDYRNIEDISYDSTTDKATRVMFSPYSFYNTGIRDLNFAGPCSVDIDDYAFSNVDGSYDSITCTPAAGPSDYELRGFSQQPILKEASIYGSYIYVDDFGEWFLNDTEEINFYNVDTTTNGTDQLELHPWRIGTYSSNKLYTWGSENTKQLNVYADSVIDKLNSESSNYSVKHSFISNDISDDCVINLYVNELGNDVFKFLTKRITCNIYALNSESVKISGRLGYDSSYSNYFMPILNFNCKLIPSYNNTAVLGGFIKNDLIWDLDFAGNSLDKITGIFDLNLKGISIKSPTKLRLVNINADYIKFESDANELIGGHTSFYVSGVQADILCHYGSAVCNALSEGSIEHSHINDNIKEIIVKDYTKEIELNQKDFDGKGYVSILYNNGDEKNVPLDKLKIRNFSSNTYGKRTLEVGLCDDWVPFEVEVVKPASQTIVSSYITNVTTIYDKDQVFDGNGKLVLTYKDGHVNVINIEDSMLTGFDTTSLGRKVVTVNYDDQVLTYEIVVRSVGGDTRPPEALTMINYEFYKNYPDYVIIPLKMNDATTVTRLVIGKDEVPDTAWELQDSAIILDKDWLANLDAGKYRVKPTFNDRDNTTISNIQIIVYDKVSDRGAPYLLQSVIDFSGQTLRLKFDGGFGDLGAERVLALVIDDELILPNGDRMPFSKSNVTKVQKAMEVVEEDDEELYDVLFEEEEEDEEEIATSSNARPATPSNATYRDEDDEAFEEELIDDLQVATPSNATYKKSSSKKVKGSSVSLIRAMADTLFSADTVFYTEGDEIVVDGDYISSMDLTPGDHLVGAIFDNTERTTDVKKVVLRIADDSDTDDGNTDNPGGEDKPDQKPNPDGENKPNPGEDGKPDTGENNKPGEDNKPGTNKPSKPNGGGSSGGGSGGSSEGSSGGSSGGGSGSRPSGSKPSEPGKNNDGSYNTGYKPSVPNTGGNFLMDENGNKVYMFPDGETPKATWVGDGKNWYYVEANGMVRTDWFLDSATGYWYQLCKEPGDNYGAMLYGWYYEIADGKWYFLSPIDGHMLIGWQFINHEWYYMTEVNNGQTYFGDNINGWLYDPTKAWKPFGSMWCNEMTPDNYFVTESGAWKK